MTQTPEDLLNEIESVWFSGRRAYRDSLLRVGDLLHAYLLASEPTPREDAVKAAVKRLRFTNKRIHHLIHVSQAVSLLGAGRDLANVSYAALCEFKKCVHRPTGNQWILRDLGDLDPLPLFVTAIETPWTVPEARKALKAAKSSKDRQFGVAPPSGRSNDRPCRSGLPVDVLALARRGNPKDIADLVEQLVAGAPDARALAELITAKLAILIKEGVPSRARAS